MKKGDFVICIDNDINRYYPETLTVGKEYLITTNIIDGFFDTISNYNSCVGVPVDKFMTKTQYRNNTIMEILK